MRKNCTMLQRFGNISSSFFPTASFCRGVYSIESENNGLLAYCKENFNILYERIDRIKERNKIMKTSSLSLEPEDKPQCMKIGFFQKINRGRSTLNYFTNVYFIFFKRAFRVRIF